MADNELGHGLVEPGHGVACGGRKRQKRAFFFQAAVDTRGARGGADEVRCVSSEEAAGTVIAIGAGYEDAVAGHEVRGAASFDDFPGGFVAGHKRIAHAGERRHPAIPEQFLGAG